MLPDGGSVSVSEGPVPSGCRPVSPQLGSGAVLGSPSRTQAPCTNTIRIPISFRWSDRTVDVPAIT
jgi:hypothetical protein